METMEKQTHTLDTPDVDLVYDVVGPLPTTDGRPPLLMAGHPMAAEGFFTVAEYFPERTVVVYDPRGVGRSVRKDGRTERSPELHVADLHALITEIGAPVDIFASSGGAVNSLALVAEHPDDVRILVAHEPPLLALLPDADGAFAAERAVTDAYHQRGFGAGMAQFIALTSWHGEFNDAYAAQPPPDPAMFGMPTEDDGGRDDPLLSGTAAGITAYRPDADALNAAPTRVVIGVGVESRDTITGRTSVAMAQALGQEVVEFPSHHGGFLGGEFGYAGQPEAFAERLHEVLDSKA
ncbi:MAG TPA: alpha/beta hydrolase [Lapillicoccus sp.]|jgi:pimeloyl-ACP methyl ester carboxylesterase|uniref:alpha/beta fold hydrolase n=1 Tax=Lapillicoccus sp. TaxID=1909287 RepID=UPI002F9449BD